MIAIFALSSLGQISRMANKRKCGLMHIDRTRGKEAEICSSRTGVLKALDVKEFPGVAKLHMTPF